MDPSLLFYLSLGAVILTLVIFMGIFLVPRLLRNIRGRGAGWTRLAEKFPAPFQPEGTVFSRQTIQVGSVVYKNCATVVAADEGLYLAVNLPFFFRFNPLLLPWESLHGVRESRLYWRKTVILSIGNPEIGTVTLFRDLYEKIEKLGTPG
jgi:hypothetical protein